MKRRYYRVNNKQGISLAFSGIALLFFCYISVLGLGYFIEGFFESDNLSGTLPSFMSKMDPLLFFYFVISLVYLILMAVLLLVLCISKSKRNKRIGLPVEIVSGLFIIVLLVMGSIPFMKFLCIVENEELLLSEVGQMRESALDVDASYYDYVNKRVENFIEYSGEYYGKFSKSTANSLMRRLIPLNYEEIKKERASWLNEMSVVNIWNPCTAHNIKAIMKASETWTKEYSNFSSIFYQYEMTESRIPYSCFEHRVSKLNRDKWTENFKKVEFPDWRALAILVFVIVMILILYLSIDRPLNTITGTHKNS